MKMQVTFKSGAQIEVDVDEYTCSTNKVTGELTGLDWTFAKHRGASRLSWVRLSEVVAVVRRGR